MSFVSHCCLPPASICRDSVAVGRHERHTSPTAGKNRAAHPELALAPGRHERHGGSPCSVLCQPQRDGSATTGQGRLPGECMLSHDRADLRSSWGRPSSGSSPHHQVGHAAILQRPPRLVQSRSRKRAQTRTRDLRLDVDVTSCSHAVRARTWRPRGQRVSAASRCVRRRQGRSGPRSGSGRWLSAGRGSW
jgi:hypothetical protein